MTTTRRSDSGQAGQAIALLALALTALLAMLALIVDVGYAYGHRRATQNAADAAAEAGAGVLAENLIRQGSSYPQQGDSVVYTRVQAMAAANEVDTPLNAYYTDIEGGVLAPVGGGSIPAGAWGVMAEAHKSVPTSFARVIGVDMLDVAASATAVSGYLTATCTADTGCALLPITFLATTYSCDETGRLVPEGEDWAVGQYVVLPMCKDASGNVGFIDWYPPSGGTSELVDTIYNPNNPPITLPDWYWVAQTGNTNAGAVEDAINSYHDQVVLVPMFDAVCAQGSGDKPSNEFGCPEGSERGGGQNLWYHFVQFTAIQLDWAYVQGDNRADCGTMSGVNACITGTIVRFVTSGEVSASPPIGSNPQVVAVQLIK